ncbi:MAG: response regulator [Acidobacteria bacterium]|nr:response regulator [Acidobacteriota bacterium]
MALNVLVVDDSAVMRTMVIKTLRLCGLSLSEIYQAGNGAEGLKILDQDCIDLALVDINMPVMNGEEMIHRVRSNPLTADLPVIVVSTEGSMARIAALERIGVGFVHKPFNPVNLRKMIINVTGGIDAPTTADSASPSSGYDF